MTVHSEPLSSQRRLLLEHAIDYAGLFPPAGLAMPEAVTNYLAYRSSPDAWALGRFVVPVGRLTEFAAALPASLGRDGPVAVSALVANPVAPELSLLQSFEAGESARRVAVESLECRVDTPAETRRALGELPARKIRYVEVPFGPAIGEFLDLIAAAGAFAKLRTGGVTPDAIPAPAAVAAALVALGTRRLPFKATAGLHHPLTAEYPLTYAPGSPRARMYGYLNLMAAAAFAFSGRPARDVERALLALEENDFAAVDAVRPRFLHGFGSCSFREPLDEFPRSGAVVPA